MLANTPSSRAVVAFLERLHDDPLSTGYRAPTTGEPTPKKRVPFEHAAEVRLRPPPPSWASPEPGATSAIDDLGDLLFHSAGCHRVRWQPQGAQFSSPEHPHPLNAHRRWEIRRVVASGGGMYPTTLHVLAWGVAGLPVGSYRYDALAHRLTGRRGLAVDLVQRTTGPHIGAANRLGFLVVVTCGFARSTPKYGNFAYRLTAVDTGLVVGRLVRLLGPDAAASLEFDDDIVESLFDLEDDEAAYAVVGPGGCWAHTPSPWTARMGTAPARSAFRALPDELVQAHTAARETHPVEIAGAAPTDRRTARPEQRPPSPLDPAVLEARRSDGSLFDGRVARRADVEAIVYAALNSMRDLAAASTSPLPEIQIGVCVGRVGGLLAGAYRVTGDGWTCVSAEDPTAVVEGALHARTIDVRRSAFTVHLIGPRDFGRGLWGTRGYRVTQMTIGAAADAVTLAASHAGLSAHPLLGFEPSRLDHLYDVAGHGLGVQAQLTVGHARSAARIEGSVMV